MNNKYEQSFVIGTRYSTSIISRKENKKLLEESCKIAFQAAFPHVYELYGIMPDACLREHYYYDGKYWNSYIFSLLKSEVM